jgi:glucose-6-phosphate isomerase
LTPDHDQPFSSKLRYDPSLVYATPGGVSPQEVQRIEAKVLAARDTVLREAALVRSGAPIPNELEPLDAEFIDLPEKLLDEDRAMGDGSELRRILASAERFSQSVDRFVVVGIGGSYMGTRGLFEALCRPYHNEHLRPDRENRPRVYFDGYNVDNDPLHDLLALLRSGSADGVSGNWGMVVVSKSGRTLEPALVFRRLLAHLNEQQARPEVLGKLVLVVTGQKGPLRAVAQSLGCRDIFAIPERVGGRYSVLSAAGLLPAAILGIDVVALLQGAAAMARRFREAPLLDNPVLHYVAVSHLMEVTRGATCRVLSMWGKQLEAVGFWHDQLLSESLGKSGQGATPLAIVNTRDLHSRGQQHQQGAHDKMITNIIIGKTRLPVERVGSGVTDLDELGDLAGFSFPEVMAAATKGVSRAYSKDGRPTADLFLPQLDAFSVGELLQMLMLATAVEGRLIDVNPYGQPGVEAYKKEMNTLLGRT